MPLYEYYCPDCSQKFELLRPVGRMDEEAICPQGHSHAQKVLSVFAAVSSGGKGEPVSLGGCACSAGGACGCGTPH
ncbi:MAG TPA: zinc ribbon domain-containing protein [Dehalococcoidia bacterium]|nr:zinc ribbon domain-containing protein [Dehalococcoidia bacterium]